MSAINTLTCDAAHGPAAATARPPPRSAKAPQAVITDPATGTVYAANFTDSTVSVVNPARCNAARTARLPPPGSHRRASAPARTRIAVDRASYSTSTSPTAATTRSRSSTPPPATRTAEPAAGGPPPPSAVGSRPGRDSRRRGHRHRLRRQRRRQHGLGHQRRHLQRHQHSGCGQTPPTITVGSGPFGHRRRPGHRHRLRRQQSAPATRSQSSTPPPATPPALRLRPDPPTINVGTGPLGIAVNQATDTVYVTNLGDFSGNTVSVINAATCNGSPAFRLRPDSGDDHRRSRPVGHRHQPGQQHHLRRQQQRRRRPGQPLGDQRRYLRRSQHHRMRPDPARLPGVGRAPNGIAIDQSTHTVYTANALDATVSVIDVTPIPGHPNYPPRVAVGSTARSHRHRPRQPHHLHRRRIRRYSLDPARAASDRAGNDGSSDLRRPPAPSNQSAGQTTPPSLLPPRQLPVINCQHQGFPTFEEDEDEETPEVRSGFPGGHGAAGLGDRGATCNAQNTSGCSHMPPTVKVGSNPVDVSLNKATDTVYVANWGNGTRNHRAGHRRADLQPAGHPGCGQIPAIVYDRHPRVQWVVATRVFCRVLTIGHPGGARGCRACQRGRPVAWPWCQPARGCGGSGGKAGRQAVAQRCAAALPPEGQARKLRGTPWGMTAAAKPPPFRPLPGPGPAAAPRRAWPSPGSCGAGSSAGRRPPAGPRGCARPGSCPWGSTAAAARWCSRCCHAARENAGRRSRYPDPR